VLTDKEIKSLKPQDKNYKKADSDSLYLLVRTSGGMSWMMNYRYGGVQKTLTFGTYPKVGLKAARKKRDEAKENLSNYIDPASLKRAKKLAGRDSLESSFEIIGGEY